MRKHTWNALLLIGAILLFCYGIWQLNMAFQGTIWADDVWKQDFYFWYPYLHTNIGMATDLTMGMMVSAFIFGMIALWFWND